jgi:hypothetical protein
MFFKSFIMVSKEFRAKSRPPPPRGAKLSSMRSCNARMSSLKGHLGEK